MVTSFGHFWRVFFSISGEGDSQSHDLVWLQGEVTNVSEDKDIIQLREDLDVVLVSGCAKVPGNAADLAKGDYCQVLGQVDHSNKNSRHYHTVVRAVKVVNLTRAGDNVGVLRAAWHDEVIELEKVCCISSSVS